MTSTVLYIFRIVSWFPFLVKVYCYYNNFFYCALCLLIWLEKSMIRYYKRKIPNFIQALEHSDTNCLPTKIWKWLNPPWAKLKVFLIDDNEQDLTAALLLCHAEVSIFLLRYSIDSTYDSIPKVWYAFVTRASSLWTCSMVKWCVISGTSTTVAKRYSSGTAVLRSMIYLCSADSVMPSIAVVLLFALISTPLANNLCGERWWTLWIGCLLCCCV